MPLVAFEDFELDEACFELRQSGIRLKLEPKTFDVLRYLVSNRDRVVTKRELLDILWPEQCVTEAVLHTHVALARRVLRDDRRGRLIETLHGRGYRFVGDVLAAH